jgi:hypothetical protein
MIFGDSNIQPVFACTQDIAQYQVPRQVQGSAPLCKQVDSFGWFSVYAIINDASVKTRYYGYAYRSAFKGQRKGAACLIGYSIGTFTKPGLVPVLSFGSQELSTTKPFFLTAASIERYFPFP